jgi:Transposase
VAGIDWASELHVACVLDVDGAVAGRFSFTHDAAAIRTMIGRLRSAGVARVAIERGDGPVVEELLAAGLAVFVVPSRDLPRTFRTADLWLIHAADCRSRYSSWTCRGLRY